MFNFQNFIIMLFEKKNIYSIFEIFYRINFYETNCFLLKFASNIYNLFKKKFKLKNFEKKNEFYTIRIFFIAKHVYEF